MKLSVQRLSFKYRLMLWFLLLFVASAIAFEIYAYTELRSVLLSQLDASLMAEGDRVAEDLDIGSGDPLAPGGVQNQSPVSSSATGYSFRVIDGKGVVLGQRNAFPKIEIAMPIISGITTINSGQERYRLATREIEPVSGDRRYYLQAARSLSSVDEALRESLLRYLYILPFALAAAVFGSVFLAKGALRPVSKLTTLAESVQGNTFSGRMHYVGPMDEIGRLARAFDAMLEDIQASFDREKRFSADASHELRTPLTALKGNLDVTLSRPRSASEYKHALSQMSIQVDRLIRLSSDLLLFARAGSGALRRAQEKVDLSGLLELCLAQYADEAHSKQLTISCEIDKGIEIRGSPDHLMRLFLNLLDNAVKYSEQGGMVILRARVETTTVIVEVENSGPGIAPEDLEKVFDPFFRGAADRSRESGGSGLGLAIAREIALAHGGGISFTNAPNALTVARVSLPLVRN